MIRIFIFLTVWLFLVNAEASVVHTVYFQPADQLPPTANDIKIAKDVMHKTQVFYLREMKRHKYAPKTFNLERDDAGQIVIHVVKGKHNLQLYSDYDRIYRELPFRIRRDFIKEKKICVVFFTGATNIKGAAGSAFEECMFRSCGHIVAIPTKTNFDPDIERKHIMLLTTVHELGHAFRLGHNFNTPPDQKTFIMYKKLILKPKPFDINNYIFDADEAERLNKHEFFVEAYRDVAPNRLRIKTWSALKQKKR